MLTEQSFNTGAVTINYAEGGASEQPLLLLHGGSARWQSFLPIIPELAQHLRFCKCCDTVLTAKTQSKTARLLREYYVSRSRKEPV